MSNTDSRRTISFNWVTSGNKDSVGVGSNLVDKILVIISISSQRYYLGFLLLFWFWNTLHLLECYEEYIQQSIPVRSRKNIKSESTDFKIIQCSQLRIISYKWFCFKNISAQSYINFNLPQQLSLKPLTWEMFFDAIVCKRALKALVMASRNSVSSGSSVRELNPKPKLNRKDKGYMKQRNMNSLIVPLHATTNRKS